MRNSFQRTAIAKLSRSTPFYKYFYAVSSPSDWKRISQRYAIIENDDGDAVVSTEWRLTPADKKMLSAYTLQEPKHLVPEGLFDELWDEDAYVSLKAAIKLTVPQYQELDDDLRMRIWEAVNEVDHNEAVEGWSDNTLDALRLIDTVNELVERAGYPGNRGGQGGIESVLKKRRNTVSTRKITSDRTKGKAARLTTFDDGTTVETRYDRHIRQWVLVVEHKGSQVGPAEYITSAEDAKDWHDQTLININGLMKDRSGGLLGTLGRAFGLR